MTSPDFPRQNSSKLNDVISKATINVVGSPQSFQRVGRQNLFITNSRKNLVLNEMATPIQGIKDSHGKSKFAFEFKAAENMGKNKNSTESDLSEETPIKKTFSPEKMISEFSKVEATKSLLKNLESRDIIKKKIEPQIAKKIEKKLITPELKTTKITS
jgi:hypothetical protein